MVIFQYRLNHSYIALYHSGTDYSPTPDTTLYAPQEFGVSYYWTKVSDAKGSVAIVNFTYDNKIIAMPIVFYMFHTEYSGEVGKREFIQPNDRFHNLKIGNLGIGNSHLHLEVVVAPSAYQSIVGEENKPIVLEDSPFYCNIRRYERQVKSWQMSDIRKYSFARPVEVVANRFERHTKYFAYENSDVLYWISPTQYESKIKEYINTQIDRCIGI